MGDAELNGEMDPEIRDDSLSKEAQNPSIIRCDLKSVCNQVQIHASVIITLVSVQCNILVDPEGGPSVVGISTYRTTMTSKAVSMI